MAGGDAGALGGPSRNGGYRRREAVDNSTAFAPLGLVIVVIIGIGVTEPELTQAAYRVGDSTTNIITPLMPYVPVIIAFAQRWDRKAGFGTLIAAMVTYSVLFMLGGDVTVLARSCGPR